MKWLLGALGALSLSLAGLGVDAQILSGPGGNPANAVAVWGVNSAGQPCIIAPVGATGAVTCWLPPGSGGGGGGVTTTPFTPTANATLAASSASSNVAISTSGTPTVLVVTNLGSNAAYVNLGTTNAVTATVSNTPIQPGQTMALNLGANSYVAGITASSTASLTITAGTGTPVVTAANATLITTAVTAGTNATTAAVAAASCTQPCQVVSAPSSSSGVGIAPYSSAALESGHVLKASPGNLYSLYMTTTGTAGYLMTFNATTVPVDGAVTPVDCVQVGANGTASINTGPGLPDVYSTGIAAAFSTSGCFTKTASATVFIKARVQ